MTKNDLRENGKVFMRLQPVVYGFYQNQVFNQ